jgi:hypothetical protein
VMTLNWMPCLSNSLSSGAIWPAVSWGPAHILSLRLLFFLLAPVIMIWNWAEERYKVVVSAGFYKLYIVQCNWATELTLTDTVNFNRTYHGGGWGHAKLPKGGHANLLFNSANRISKHFGCISLSKNRKLLRWASLQIANSPQIA